MKTSFVVAMFLGLAICAAKAEPIVDAAGHIEPIPDDIWNAMQGKSFNGAVKGCALRARLRLLTLPYWNLDGKARSGHLIMHASAAETVRGIFVKLYADKSYRIARMELVDAFGGNDRASMAANNTSAYNCRVVAGSKRLSNHALGLAIDVNPLINPYVWRRGTSPPGGAPWDTKAEREAARNTPGMILPDSPIVKAFKKAGWGWGGDWSGTKDYQHFSHDGR